MILIVLAALAAPAEEAPVYFGTVEDKVLVYEQPNLGSNVVRRLYFGELVRVDEELIAPDGRRWTEVKLGPDMLGYVESVHLIATEELPRTAWRPSHVVRDERPLGVATRIGGETFGAGVNLRYLAYSRIGLSTTIGAVIDDGVVRGSALSLGVCSYLVLWNLSPMLEIGTARLAYHRQHATLNTAIWYLSTGAEWIFDFGAFAGVMATYYRGLSQELAFDYEQVQTGNVSVPSSFGVLDAGDDGVLQGFRLGATIGYGF